MPPKNARIASFRQPLMKGGSLMLIGVRCLAVGVHSPVQLYSFSGMAVLALFQITISLSGKPNRDLWLIFCLLHIWNSDCKWRC